MAQTRLKRPRPPLPIIEQLSCHDFYNQEIHGLAFFTLNRIEASVKSGDIARLLIEPVYQNRKRPDVSGLGFTRRFGPRRGLGLERIVRPSVFGITPFEVFFHCMVTARPKAREVLRDLHRAARRRKQMQ